jgi:phage terminase large subunit-like protein
MVPATTLFTDAVRDQTVTHDGNVDLARHVANAKIKRDAKGPRIVKEHANSAKKIDLAVAAMVALDRGMNQPQEVAASSGPNIW